MESPENHKELCLACFEEINIDATKCKHCGSFQDWRKNIILSNSILALLIALISVVSLSIPVFTEAFKNKNSNIILSYQTIKYGHAITILASNTGTRPGGVSTAILEVRGQDDNVIKIPVEGSNWAGATTFIKENDSVQLRYDLSRGDKFPSQLKNLNFKDKLSNYTFTFIVPVNNFDQTIDKFSLNIPVDHLKKWLRNDEESVVKFENEIFSVKVGVGSRTYFFDVKESKEGTRYFTISESRQSGEKHEHSRIMVFEESFEVFGVAFKRMSDFLASLTKGKTYDVKDIRREYPQACQPWSAENDQKLSVKYRQ